VRYVDTSTFVPLFLPETRSSEVRAWFTRLDIAEIVISTWTMTEFASALGRKVRAGAATADAATRARGAFLTLARRSLQQVVPSREDFLMAARLLERFELGLRAGDALHVAIALRRGVTSLVTLDRGMARAAVALGVSDEMPI